MIDISNKKVSKREAVVEGVILSKPEVIAAIKKKQIPKGDVLATAKIAGILAAKNTASLIPLCHPIPIDFIQINFSVGEEKIRLTTTVKGNTKTGVEMEAFAATTVACLTIYDMCKALDREMVISGIRLLKKSGGKGGAYVRNKK